MARARLLSRLTFFVALCLYFVATLPQPIEGQISFTCIPLDVVFLIDQSDSTRSTDPEGIRIKAVQAAIAALYDHAAYTCPSTLFRTAVIGFGTDATAYLDFSQLESHILIGSDARGDWTAERDLALSRIVNETRGNSSYYDAMLIADAQLATPSGVDDDSLREQHVILLIDGPPCPTAAAQVDAAGQRLCASPQWLEHYLYGNVPQYINVGSYQTFGFDFPYGLDAFLLSSQALGGTTHFDMIYFLPNSTEQSAIYGLFEDFVELRGGRFVSPVEIDGDYRQIAVILDSILSPYFGSNRSLIPFTPVGTGRCRGTFVLSPYLGSAALLTVLNPEDGGSPQLATPDSSAPQVAFEPYTALYQQAVLLNVIPGTWTIDLQGDCDRADARIEILPIDVEITAPQAAPINTEEPYLSTDETYVVVRLSTTFGTVKAPVAYPLEICGRFITTSQRGVRILEELYANEGCFAFAQEGAEWRSQTPLPAPATGTYVLQLEGRVPTWVEGGETFRILVEEITYLVDPAS